MKQSPYTLWHLHLAKELDKDYRKLKLTKQDEKIIQTVSRRKSNDIPRV